MGTPVQTAPTLPLQRDSAELPIPVLELRQARKDGDEWLAERKWIPEEAALRFALVLAELLTNAFQHGGGIRSVQLDVTPGQLQMSVTDREPGRIPELVEHPLESGRGYHIVRALAASWGVTVHGDHKHVYASIDLVSEDT